MGHRNALIRIGTPVGVVLLHCGLLILLAAHPGTMVTLGIASSGGPPTSPFVPAVAWAAYTVFALTLLQYVSVVLSDPGYVRPAGSEPKLHRGRASRDPEHRGQIVSFADADYVAAWLEQKQQNEQLDGDAGAEAGSTPGMDLIYSDGVCRIDRLIRPLRTRHCWECGRCVQRYDHHCIWTGSCVGALNHRAFAVFLFLEMTNILVSSAVAVHAFATWPGSAGHLAMLIIASVSLLGFGIFVGFLVKIHIQHIATNGTTFEMVVGFYLPMHFVWPRDNPYNRATIGRNVIDFFLGRWINHVYTLQRSMPAPEEKPKRQQPNLLLRLCRAPKRRRPAPSAVATTMPAVSAPSPVTVSAPMPALATPQPPAVAQTHQDRLVQVSGASATEAGESLAGDAPSLPGTVPQSVTSQEASTGAGTVESPVEATSDRAATAGPGLAETPAVAPVQAVS